MIEQYEYCLEQEVKKILETPKGENLNYQIHTKVFNQYISKEDLDYGEEAPRYSEDFILAWEIILKYKNTILFSGRKRFGQILQNVMSEVLGVKGGVIAFEDLIWHLTPEIICKTALIYELEKSS